jgi:hypothetical protein
MSPNAPNNIYLPPVLLTPGQLIISAISQSNPMVVTIVNSSFNTYIAGQLVYLSIPQTYGMSQASGMTGQITNVNGLNFTLNIDSSQYDPFIIPVVGKESPASLSPAGSRNVQFNNFTYQVPFKDLNNIGN